MADTAETKKPVFTKLSPPERTRIYTFPSGATTVFHNVTALAVSERGTHRLEHGGNEKSIVPAGWIRIDLNVDTWTL